MATKTFVLSIILLMLGIFGPSFAQEKKKKKPQAPPTRISLPADTTQSHKKAAAKKEMGEKVDKRLQLPEVLIYGKDTTNRIAGKKITISPDQPDLVTPQSLYEPLQGEAMDRGSRSDFNRPIEEKKSQVELSAFGGQFSQFGGGAKFWQARSKVDYGMEAGYAQTYGQYRNSAREDLTGVLRLGIRSGETGKWRFAGEYSSSRYGLYGAQNPDDDRKSAHALARVNGQFQASPTMQVQVQASLQLLTLRNLPAALPLANQLTDNFNYRLRAGLKKQFKNSDLNFAMAVIRDRVQPDGLKDQIIGWQQWGVSYSFSPSRKISARVSSAITVSEVQQKKRSRFSPDLRVIFAPNRKLIVTARVRRGFQYAPWLSRVQANPYLQLSAFALPEDILWRLDASVEWRFIKGVILQANFERQRIDDYAYFERGSAGTFLLNSADARLGKFTLGANIDFSPSVHLEIALNTFEDAIRRDGQLITLIDFPYRPEMQIPLKLQYKPTKAWKIDAEMLYEGRRKTNLSTQKELPSFMNLGLQVRYKFARGIEIFVQAKNLLDESYVLWEGYPEMGIHGVVGLQARW